MTIEPEMTLDGRTVRLTNLDKPFWNSPLITKRDLLSYYAAISDVLVPHLRERAMVMKRYPNGAEGKFFFMKRTPSPRPDWLRTCAIEHGSGSVIDFPIIDDLAALLWVINLGCIDLNPWYSTCDDVNRPNYLHFDLDPTPGARFKHVLETACAVREELEKLGIRSYPKTTGSRGIHIYVAIVRGPLQKQVWTFAKKFAIEMAARYPTLITSEYKVAKRPEKHVLVDYNQNAWGRTLASVYSVRPQPGATVSAPVTWEEVQQGFHIRDFHLRNMPERVKEIGDLYAPLLAGTGRVNLEALPK
jgi:bifunctional non-homologous end joining protein LigD